MFLKLWGFCLQKEAIKKKKKKKRAETRDNKYDKSIIFKHKCK